MTGRLTITVSMTILAILVLIAWTVMGVRLWHQRKTKKPDPDLESGTATASNGGPTGPTPKGAGSQRSFVAPAERNMPPGTQWYNQQGPAHQLFKKVSSSFSKKKPADVNLNIVKPAQEPIITVAGPRYISSPRRAVPAPQMAPPILMASCAATFHMATPPASTVTEDSTNTAPRTARNSGMVTRPVSAAANSPKPASVTPESAPAEPERSPPPIPDRPDDEEDLGTRPPVKPMSPL